MGLRQRIKNAALVHLGKPRYQAIVDRENEIPRKFPCVTSEAHSPVRFEIPFEAIKRIQEGSTTQFFSFKILPVLFGSIKGILRSIKHLSRNPPQIKTQIPPKELQTVEDFAHSLGIGMLGYYKLPPKYIFQQKGILYENCMVLIMEMQADAINEAPSYATFHEVHRTYRDLGIATNRLARFLRNLGYGTHPVHPLGGAVLTPPLAQLAGLGWPGRNGLIITPQFGPRMRIATVFTSIENLPFATSNPHRWIEDYCQTCGKCVRSCPSSAIDTQSRTDSHGFQHSIDVSRCFPYFLENHGCSICIKVCPFNTLGYSAIQSRFKIQHPNVKKE